MAKQKGIVYFYGSIGDLTFYQQGGQYYVRAKSNLNKKRVMNDAAFERSRARMKEFGLGSKLGKLLRSGLMPLSKMISDPTMVNRLASLFRTVIRAGATANGVQSFNASLLPDYFGRYNFKQSTTIENQLVFDRSKIDVSVVGTIVNVGLNSINVCKPLKNNKSVTHYKVSTTSVGLSDFVFDASINQYNPINGDGTLQFSLTSTGYLSVDEALNTQLETCVLNNSEQMDGFTTITVLAVQFYQEVDGKMYELQELSAMEIMTG